MTAKWSPREQKAFHAFIQEADKFFNVHANNGMDLEGTFEIQEEVFLWNNFVASLEAFEHGDLPKHSAVEARRAGAVEYSTYLKTQSGDAAR